MFTGFTDETFDFLFKLSLNNERVWYSEHKELCRSHLLQPMNALAHDVFEGLTKCFPNANLVCKVARIYRDARRYHGVAPFRESLWFSIRSPEANWQDSPNFWFELRRNKWSYGMGLYSPKPATMARHRYAIDHAPSRLRLLNGTFAAQSEFSLQGETYARYKPCAQSSLSGWYNYKSISLIHESDDMKLVTDGPALVRRLVGGFRFLMPFYNYFYPLCEAAQGSADLPEPPEPTKPFTVIRR